MQVPKRIRPTFRYSRYGKRKTAAALIILGVLAAGCASEPNALPEKADEPQTESSAANAAPAEVKVPDPAASPAALIDPSHYRGSSVKRDQIDLLNQLLAAQNAGDQEGYAAMFAADTPEAAKRITFRVEQIQLYSANTESEKESQVEGAIREEPNGGDHPVVYKLNREAGEWRVGSIERAAGPYADEKAYTGEESEIVKLINASTRYRNGGDAPGYKQLFKPGGQMGDLGAYPGKIEETLISRIETPNENGVVIVNVLQRYEGQRDIKNPAFALGQEDGKWFIYDID
ncbi:hypothetical protein [Saccharibacillus deserti]|uniref:hypothetical protein n=1 Tax=Saccharibacillus deserti TaxID=1634444 RepID=UPI00155372F3|nr:hypothetical protein [Saccharibacillus deserti]